jgi:mutator protein MutT
MPHEIAAALIVRSGKILLGRRSPARKFYPDVWDVFGGHVEPGEKHEQTLIREVQEELGITPTDWTFLETTVEQLPTDAEAQGTPNFLVAHLYLVTAWTGMPINRQPEEHSEIRWFSLDEIRQLELADPGYPELFERYLPQIRN